MTRTMTSADFQQVVDTVKQFESGYLRDLATIIEDTLKSRKKQDRQNAIAEIHKIAVNAGIPIQELLNMKIDSKTGRTNGPAPIKYQHPNDNTLTWSGRGRMPLWLEKEEKAGKSREDFLINQA